MRIAVSASGKTPDSPMDPRFGRAEYFIFMETDTMEHEAAENAAAASSGGAGIAAAQSVVDKGAKAVVTGYVGPNAMSVLRAAGMEIYKGAAATVRENAELCKAGRLERIDASAPAHFGMGLSGGEK